MRRPDETERCNIETVADILRKRASLLNLLAEAPRDQRELRDELDVSRSTVYKSLQTLQEANLIADQNGSYRLTGFGRLAWQRHDDYIARLRQLDIAHRFLETLPDDQQFPLTLFEHGQIIVPGRHAPERPLDRLSELGEHTSHLQVLSPSGMPRFLADIHANVEAGEQTATIVTERDAISRLRSGYDRFEEATTADGLALYSVPDELPYAIVIFDSDELGLFGYEGGILVGAVFTGGREALSWGTNVFARALDRAEQI